MDAKKIGNAIKILRKRHGFTQYDLADALNVTDKAISKWERGLSIPDISVITELSNLLDVDVDNLLEGNIAFLEETWNGVFLGSEESGCVGADTRIYGKPAVYFALSYFMLAGIRRISLFLNARDEAFMREAFADGSALGLALTYHRIGQPLESKGNTMLIRKNFFLYGPNLTKHFQRAMSRLSRATVLVANRRTGNEADLVSYDNAKRITNRENWEYSYYRLPVLFVPEKLSQHLQSPCPEQSLLAQQLLFAEPMGRGMVDCLLETVDDVADVANFIRFVQEKTGYDLYEVEQVAKNRGLT